MKRRGFIATLLGAAGYRPSLKAAAPVPALQDALRHQRYMIAREWPRDQRRMDFIMKGEITGFRYGHNFFVGHVWHELDRPYKVGDTVRVVTSRKLHRLSSGFCFHVYHVEPFTLTPEFLTTNGFRMPTVAEQYAAARISNDPIEFKWFMDDAKVFIAGD